MGGSNYVCQEINMLYYNHLGRLVSVKHFCGFLSEDPLRLVLVGSSGVGKSAAGNTILGTEAFMSELSPSPLTLTSEGREGEVCGRRVIVVDTPGLFNTELSGEKLKEEMERAVNLCHPGPHAFLLVIQLGRFTQQEQRVMETLQELFSKKVNEYTIVLFTYGDRLGNQTIENFIRSDTNLQHLLKKCSNCYHVFCNNLENSDQVKSLIEKVNLLLENKPPFHDVRGKGSITHDGIFTMILSFAQRFAKPIIGVVLGAAVGGLAGIGVVLGTAVGGLAGGIIGAAIGAAVGCVLGEAWRRYSNRGWRRRFQ